MNSCLLELCEYTIIIMICTFTNYLLIPISNYLFQMFACIWKMTSKKKFFFLLIFLFHLSTCVSCFFGNSWFYYTICCWLVFCWQVICNFSFNFHFISLSFNEIFFYSFSFRWSVKLLWIVNINIICCCCCCCQVRYLFIAL